MTKPGKILSETEREYKRKKELERYYLMKELRKENHELDIQHKDTARKHILKKLGMTNFDFYQTLIKQGYKCAICDIPFCNTNGSDRSTVGKPYIDHDHKTGKFRGLLCQNCNSMLGNCGDNIAIILSARDYLIKNGGGAERKPWSGCMSGKIWGKTTTFIRTPFFELHRIEVLPNACCSLHKHDNKNNTFVVTSGVLFVDVHKNDYDLVDTTELHQFGVLTVKPGEYHQFKTGNIGAEALECYYNEPLSEGDIIRKDHGRIGLNTDGIDILSKIQF